jgi:hypothetical protein
MAVWNLTGTHIKGEYHGIQYNGIIESSRVCYGGDVEYRVRLLDMIEVYGDWRSTILVRKNMDYGKYVLDSEALLAV